MVLILKKFWYEPQDCWKSVNTSGFFSKVTWILLILWLCLPEKLCHKIWWTFKCYAIFDWKIMFMMSSTFALNITLKLIVVYESVTSFFKRNPQIHGGLRQCDKRVHENVRIVRSHKGLPIKEDPFYLYDIYIYYNKKIKNVNILPLHSHLKKYFYYTYNSLLHKRVYAWC